MTTYNFSLAVTAIQQQAIKLCVQMKTINQANQVFKLATELITISENSDPLSSTIYEAILYRRNELIKASKNNAVSYTYFPVRPKSDKNRIQAATGKRDPKRLARKRRLGDMAALPPYIRGLFTEGERAVLYIVVSDIQHRNSCCCTNKEIADRAGVGVTTTRNALRKARNHGLLNIQHREQWRGKNLANIVTLTCKRWIAWLSKFKPKLGFNYHGKGVKKAMPLETYGKICKDAQPFLNSINNTQARQTE